VHGEALKANRFLLVAESENVPAELPNSRRHTYEAP